MKLNTYKETPSGFILLDVIVGQWTQLVNRIFLLPASFISRLTSFISVLPSREIFPFVSLTFASTISLSPCYIYYFLFVVFEGQNQHEFIFFSLFFFLYLLSTYAFTWEREIYLRSLHFHASYINIGSYISFHFVSSSFIGFTLRLLFFTFLVYVSRLSSSLNSLTFLSLSLKLVFFFSSVFLFLQIWRKCCFTSFL